MPIERQIKTLGLVIEKHKPRFMEEERLVIPGKRILQVRILSEKELALFRGYFVQDGYYQMWYEDRWRDILTEPIYRLKFTEGIVLAGEQIKRYDLSGKG